MSDPVFPPEIEHIIVMCALKTKEGKGNTLDLLLTARRFHAWIIPELMRTLVMQTVPGCIPILRWPSLDTIRKYGKHTRNLFIWTTTEKFKEYCPDDDGDSTSTSTSSLFFPNVTNLLFWNNSAPPSHQFNHHHLPYLTHLSIDLSDLPSITPDIGLLFNRITHLESLTTINSQESLIKFEPFTSLTHLTIPQQSCNESFFPLLFSKHQLLRVLVCLTSDSERPMGLFTGRDSDREFDPEKDGDWRVVKMSWRPGSEMEEWLLDVEKGRGLWGLADEVVGERRKLVEGRERK